MADNRDQYSPQQATLDIVNLMRHLGIRQGHIIGCSMGAYTTLRFGLAHPGRALSLTAIGAGAGSDPAAHRAFLRQSAATAQRFEEGGLDAAALPYRNAGNRIQLENKDPRAFREFFRHFAEHSALGHANTIRGVQMRRRPLQSLGRQFARLAVPLHVLAGDEDESSLDTGLFLGFSPEVIVGR